MERFVIIDGNAILHRAFHALPPLTTSSGELVNAVFGFTSILLKIRDELKPTYLAVAFDLPKPTFRNKIFKDYQAQRPEMAKELSGQIEKVKEMVRMLGIPIYEKEGYEADDIIGTLACQLKLKIKNEKFKMTMNNEKINEETETIIVTGDRDILQLVDDSTKVYMPIKGLSETVLYDREKVREKFGLPPELIPDYKALVGDQADNYPGVSGIGPKTAISLLQQYGNFRNLYQCITTIKQNQLKTGKRLEEGKKNGELSYRLAIIVRDVPVQLDLKNCRIEDFDRPEVRELLEKLEFRSLIKRLRKTEDKGQKTDNREKQKTENTEKDNNDNQMSLF